MRWWMYPILTVLTFGALGWFEGWRLDTGEPNITWKCENIGQHTECRGHIDVLQPGESMVIPMLPPPEVIDLLEYENDEVEI